ncbi:DUF4238 domain-containing protein [Flavimobilis sp. GY10621]|uniref:DUF4238 domain-containing protein n=1 Tax=Flavimobilis rhizosphaerae TaxID=2775421 RepID=A0ABR9DMT7_9MICO|nr:DUF4238 domain-containing protein [Flavimobilis rhizosphaerae]MBD9698448.1 DUF4238 domain-containing protein [Flavimobilis rhizosphaerae]
MSDSFWIVRDRVRRQHTVPIVLLRGFVDEKNMVTVARRSGGEFTTNVTNASVRNDFYSFHGVDGNLDDAVERWFADQVEGPAAESLRLARAGIPPCVYATVPMVRFVAAGLCRTPSVRAKMDEIDVALWPQVAAQVLRRHERLRGSMQDVASVSLLDYVLTPQEENRSRLRTMMRVFEELAAILTHYSWSVATSAEPSLITSDNAIAVDARNGLWDGLVPPGARLYMPVSPQALLLAEPLPSGPIRRVLTPELATRVNQLLASSAHEFVYRHPAMPLPNGATLVPATPTMSAAATAALHPSGRTTPGAYRAQDPTVAVVMDRLNSPEIFGWRGLSRARTGR